LILIEGKMWSDDANENNYKDTILNSEMENFLSKLPLDREDLDLLLPLEGSEEDVKDHNERLSLAEKARRYDEQVAKADDVSYMLESIQHRPHEETEELLMASLDLSNDILPLMERRRLSIFDLFIPEFSSKPLKEQENVTRLFWIILLSAIVLVSAVVIIVYGEISEVPMVCMSHLRSCLCFVLVYQRILNVFRFFLFFTHLFS
jgi:hypothetical protein